jgi:outer membrane protein assembly factor BamB
MKNAVLASVSCFLLLCVSSFTPNYLSLSTASDLVSLSVRQFNVELREHEQVEQKIELNNHSNDLLYFSTIKTLDAFDAPSNTYFFQEEPETGSFWQTARCNYQRDGFNIIESSQPPFEYKWKYQSQRALRSPVVSGKYIYIPGEDGMLYVVDSRTGVYRETIPFGSVVYAVHFADRHLAVISNEGLKVYDRFTERHVWKYDAPNSSAYSFVAENGRFYYATGHSVVCLNQDTGLIMWQIPGVYTSLTLGDDIIFALSTNNVLTALNLSDGTEKFKTKLEGEVQGVPTYRDGLLYLTLLVKSNEKVSTDIVCLDRDGVIRWSYPMEKETSTSVSCDQVSAYVTTVLGDISALDRYTGKLLWHKNLSSPIHVAPTLSSSHVFVGLNNGQVHALEKNSGASVWNANFKFPIYSELVMAQGLIYTVDNTGSLVAYGRPWEKIVPPMSPENARGFPGNSIVTLYWSVSRSESDLAGYNIYRKTESERNFSFLAKIPVLNQYQDSSVRNGNRYHYIVRSYDLYGNESSNSSQISLTPSENAPPVWIDFSPNNGVVLPQNKATLQLRVRSMTLPPGSYKAYIYFILFGPSVTEDLLKLEVNLSVQQGDINHFPAPTINSVRVSDSRITLNWEPVQDAVKYQVYRSQQSGAQHQLIRELTASSDQYQDDAVKNGQLYYYVMKAINSNGTLSEFSTEISAMPQALPLQVELKDDSVLYEAVLKLQGTCDPKAKVFINTHPVDAHNQTRFTSRVGVPVGRSQIHIQAFDTDGRVQERQIYVSYLPSVLQVQLRVDDPRVEVNTLEWPYLLDVPPIIRDQRTFVPLRFLSEIIGAQVFWDPTDRKVTYKYQDIQVELWIGRKQIKINGVDREIDVAPFIENGRTLVPLRFITEPMGAKIQWDAQNRIILLYFEFN